MALCIFSFRGLFRFFVFPEILVLSALWGRILPSQTNCLRFQHRLKSDQLWATHSHGTFKVSSYCTGAKFKQITIVVCLLELTQFQPFGAFPAQSLLRSSWAPEMNCFNGRAVKAPGIVHLPTIKVCNQSQRLFLLKRRAGTVCCFFSHVLVWLLTPLETFEIMCSIKNLGGRELAFNIVVIPIQTILF